MLQSGEFLCSVVYYSISIRNCDFGPELKRTNPIELALRFWSSSNLAMQVSAKITWIKMGTFFKKKQQLGIKLWMLTECDVQLSNIYCMLAKVAYEINTKFAHFFKIME